MTVRYIQKALGGIEDLLIGQSTVTQTRNGTTYTITKINSGTLPYYLELGDVGYLSIKDKIDAEAVLLVALTADVDGFPDELKNLTTEEIQQVENIGATTISDVQWGYLGALDQALATTDSPTFADLTVTTLNTFTFDQSVETTASPTFVDGLFTGDLTVVGNINGLNTKDPVVTATSAAGTLATDFDNGKTVGAVVISTDDRILIKDQVDPKENGCYIVQATGAPVRATDSDTDIELRNATYLVSLGDLSGQQWTQTSTLPVPGADDIVFQRTYGAGGSLVRTISGYTHGLTVGQAIKSSGTADQYDTAQADSEANAEAIGIVSAVTNTTNASYIPLGPIALTIAQWDAICDEAIPTGLTAGTPYYVSPDTAGNITSVEPTTGGQVSKPMMVAISTTEAVIVNYRGVSLDDDFAKSITVTYAALDGSMEITWTHNMDTLNLVTSFRNAAGKVVPTEVVVDENTITLGFTDFDPADFPVYGLGLGAGANMTYNVDTTTVPSAPSGSGSAGSSSDAMPIDAVLPAQAVSAAPDYAEVDLSATPDTDPWTGAAPTLTAKILKVGNLVTFQIDPHSGAADTAASILLSAYIPASYRPTAALLFPVVVYDNAGYVASFLGIGTNGNVNIYKGLGGTFTGSGTAEIYGGSFSWTI